MKRTLIGAVALATAATLGAVAPADAADRNEHRTYFVPCPNDTNELAKCIWDAEHMGNGEGRSFKVRWDGRVTFISHERAHSKLLNTLRWRGFTEPRGTIDGHIQCFKQYESTHTMCVDGYRTGF